MKTRLQLIYILLLISTITIAQQTPHYTQYMYNMQTLNPAYVGVRADLSLALLGRSQWVGVEGAPETQTFSLQTRAFDGVGVGISAIHDKIGLLDETAVNLDLSYTLVVSQYDRLAFGLKGALSFYNNDLASGITPDNDTYASINGMYSNVGFGAFYYNQRFYVGLSLPYLLKTPKFRLDTALNNTGLSDHKNIFATTGIVFDMNQDVKFKPSILVKYVNALPLSVDVNANVLYKEKFELGLSYRYNDAISAMVALNVNENFKIGYAYDYTLSNFSNYNSGSHEIMLLYDVSFKKRERWLESMSCYF